MGGNKIPIGIQLYSIREDCEKDVVGSLAKVAKIGYAGVEWAGYYNRSAKDLRKLQDDNGLKCCGTHIGLDQLMPDKLAQTMEFNKILGNPYLIVPGLSKEKYEEKAWVETGKLFAELAAKVKPHGFKVGYHNHNREFAKNSAGETFWQVFGKNSGPDVVMQYDIGNAIPGGSEPVAELKGQPGRSITVHLKPYAKGNDAAPIGSDSVDWPAVFAVCESIGKTEWYIVEHESDPVSPMNAITKCFEGLKKLGKA
jgi:sugar phosphate isomerase/epimerase